MLIIKIVLLGAIVSTGIMYSVELVSNYFDDRDERKLEKIKAIRKEKDIKLQPAEIKILHAMDDQAQQEDIKEKPKTRKKKA